MTAEQRPVPTTIDELLAGITWKTFTPTEGEFEVIVQREVNDGRDNFTPEIDAIHLPTFTISTLPVTNGEFNVFLNAPDGAQQRKWWEHSFDAIQGYDLPAPTHKDLHLARTNLNYWAALAYCLWLSAKTGEFFRLPLEAEWQYSVLDGVTSFHELREWVLEWGRGIEFPLLGQFLPPYVDTYGRSYNGKWPSRTAKFDPKLINPAVNSLVKKGEEFVPKYQALSPIGLEPTLGFRLVRTGQPYSDVLAEVDTNLEDVPKLLVSLFTQSTAYLKLARAASPEATAILVDLLDSGKVRPYNPFTVLGWMSDRTDIPVQRIIDAVPEGNNNALLALSYVPVDKKLSLLREAITNGGDVLRSQALLAFRSIDPAISLAILVDKLNTDPSPSVRDTAARLIGRIKTPEALQALTDKGSDPDMKVAQVIQKMIDQLKKALQAQG